MSAASPLPVVLCGAGGRMGRAVAAAVAAAPARFRLAAEIGRGDLAGDGGGGGGAGAEPDDPATRGRLAAACARGEVVIDFSVAAATGAVLAAAAAAGRPVVVGATGHDAAQRAALDRAARALPVVLAANFSVGVNVLFWLTRQAVRLLGDGFDLEIIEAHHARKQDAPSGTARRLLEILAAERDAAAAAAAAGGPGAAARHGREGLTGVRPPHEIGVHAVRAGQIVGEHTVLFAGSGERLELTHRAADRATFAEGALRAAWWLTRPALRPAGLYDMEDVLGLRSAAGPAAPPR